MYSSTLPSNSTLDEGVGGLRHALAGLPAGKTRYLLYIGGWSGPQVRSGRVRKTLPHRDSIPSSSSPQRIRYTDYAIPRPSFLLITDLITCTLHTNLWQQIAYHKQCKGSYNTLEKQSTHRNKTEHTQKQNRAHTETTAKIYSSESIFKMNISDFTHIWILYNVESSFLNIAFIKSTAIYIYIYIYIYIRYE